MERFFRVGLVLCSLLLSCGCGKQGDGSRFKMGLMPKIKSIAYFQACAKGAQEAASELGIDLVFDGPAKDDVKEQVDMLDQWMTQGFDCIAVAPNHPGVIAPALKRARDRGITVLTFDADADAESGRQYFVNQASYDDIAQTLIDTMAEEMGGPGKVGILTSTLQAPNQSQWARRMKDYRKAKYPGMELLEEIESQENMKLGVDRARSMIQANPDLKGIICLTSIAFPAAAEAVEQERKTGEGDIDEGKKGQIHVVGLSLPSQMRKYVKRGTVQTVILWKPIDLGYLTVRVADLIHQGKMIGEGKIQAGRLGDIQVRNGYEVLLGPPMKFTAENIDQYGF
jgi:ABC-type sugar transport system substrate-binding protein